MPTHDQDVAREVEVHIGVQGRWGNRRLHLPSTMTCSGRQAHVALSTILRAARSCATSGCEQPASCASAFETPAPSSTLPLQCVAATQQSSCQAGGKYPSCPCALHCFQAIAALRHPNPSCSRPCFCFKPQLTVLAACEL